MTCIFRSCAFIRRIRTKRDSLNPPTTQGTGPRPEGDDDAATETGSVIYHGDDENQDELDKIQQDIMNSTWNRQPAAQQQEEPASNISGRVIFFEKFGVKLKPVVCRLSYL